MCLCPLYINYVQHEYILYIYLYISGLPRQKGRFVVNNIKILPNRFTSNGTSIKRLIVKECSFIGNFILAFLSL